MSPGCPVGVAEGCPAHVGCPWGAWCVINPDRCHRSDTAVCPWEDGSEVGLCHWLHCPIGALGGCPHPPYPRPRQHRASDTHWGTNQEWVYSPARKAGGGGGTPSTPRLGWVSPPLLTPPQGTSWGAPKQGLHSAACHISSPRPCFAVPTSWPEELVPRSPLRGGTPSQCPPSAPSPSAAAGSASSTHSHPGTGNGASPAGPSTSPRVRMFLEITVGTGNAGMGSTGRGELQLYPPTSSTGLPQLPRYLQWVCRCPGHPGGMGCSWGRG